MREVADIAVGACLEMRLVRKLCGQFCRQLGLIFRLIVLLLRVDHEVEEARVARRSDCE